MEAELFERSELSDAIEKLHDATAFYTAEPIVDQLLGMVNWPAGDKKLVDAACGDGNFLAAALDRLLLAEPHADDDRLAHLVQGWEIHYFAAADARARLAGILVAAGRDPARANAVAARMVTCGDFLLDGPSAPTWDCVATNPPFLRYSHLPAILRNAYEAKMPGYSQGDMLHSFLDRCTLSLRPRGEIALVTSDRWLFAACAADLRQVIGRRMGIEHLQRLDSASSFHRAKTRRKGKPPRIHPVAIVLREAALSRTPLTREPIYPDADDAAYIGCTPLADIAGIRLAPWLGKHGLFVVTNRSAHGH